MADTHGPLFDGAAAHAAREACQEIERDLATEGARMLRANLGEVLKHPTGFYQSQVNASAAGGDWQVDDSGVVYGPWLAGTGSRNRTTRFKGYAHWRRTTQELERQAEPRAQSVAGRYVRRMG